MTEAPQPTSSQLAQLISNSRPGLNKPDAMTTLLTGRGKTHGAFADHAECTQLLKEVLVEQQAKRKRRGQPDLDHKQREALEMILHKIGRIVAGDPDFQDHWDDIAGYAKIANGNL